MEAHLPTDRPLLFIARSWRENWVKVASMFGFGYPPEVRRAIYTTDSYTTNAIESLNMTLRKGRMIRISKNRS